MTVMKLAVGRTFADSDGDQFIISQINRKKNLVIFEDEDGQEALMSVSDATQAIKNGDLVLVEDDDSGDDDDADSDGDDEGGGDTDD